jgi:hypothetical protein
VTSPSRNSVVVVNALSLGLVFDFVTSGDEVFGKIQDELIMCLFREVGDNLTSNSSAMALVMRRCLVQSQISLDAAARIWKT